MAGPRRYERAARRKRRLSVLDAISIWRSYSGEQARYDFITDANDRSHPGARCAIGVLTGELAGTNDQALEFVVKHLDEMYGIPLLGPLMACPPSNCRPK